MRIASAVVAAAGPNYTQSIETAGFTLLADEPQAAGGQNAGPGPYNLLLAALGGCTGADVDHIVSKRAEPDSFDVHVTGDKIRDETGGNRLVNLAIELRVTFPEGAAGDAAREALPRAARMSHDRLCTVSRTVELGTPVDTRTAPPPAG